MTLTPLFVAGFDTQATSHGFALTTPRAGALGKAVSVARHNVFNAKLAQPFTGPWLVVSYWGEAHVLTQALRLYDSVGTILEYLTYTGTGPVVGFSGKAGAVGTIAIPAAWMHFFVAIKPGATDGRVKVWQNGELAMDWTGAVSTTPVVAYGFYGGPSSGNWGWIDDVYVGVSDTEPIAPFEVNVATLRPTGPGSRTEWVPDPANKTNWENVGDESDTSFVNSDVLQSTDLYTMGDMSVPAAEILTVQATTRGQTVGSGAPGLTHVTKSGGVETAAPSKLLAPAIGTQTSVFPVDPGTGQPWTQSGINAAEFGIRLT